MAANRLWYIAAMHTLLLPFLAWTIAACSPDVSPCEQLQEEVCACDGEAANYHCELRTQQANEAEALGDQDDTDAYDDAQEVCGEVYEDFMDAGGCGSLMLPESREG